ncbi:uncharacterized protein PV09_04521 [Verruconis gallopava]|uniref:Transcription factor domain-containing protein n=1 Tax=Verruconis gallopava TaxID=253628 RepID=A0A0D2ABL6_9PEZI|nr:uncharacterized protein PV09_04521 [Verruconis gallopava]KIW04213.1 hypothetical protein PV09_04521 [Verruconis gallopava]
MYSSQSQVLKNSTIGEQDSCSSELTTPLRSQSQRAHPIDTPRATAADQQEVNALRSRIFELESELQHRRLSSEDNRGDSRQQPTPDRVEANANSFAYGQTPASERVEEERQQDDPSDPVIKDAASILEFLAWGRRKNPDYNSVISPEASADVGPSSRDIGDTQPASSLPSDNDNEAQLAVLQLLLPEKKQVLELVRYHEEKLLWYHCSYFAPTFRNQVNVFYDRFDGSVQSPGLNLQWLALFFAVITGSITCASSQQTATWGFRLRERETLSKRWFRAVYTCLNAAEYAANQSVLSVQAVSTLTISAHLLGFSNTHSTHLATVIRIAQGLGLHRITDQSPGSAVDKECGRRLWSQLCCQDWFSIPFSDTYLINPSYSISDPPMNCHDKDMIQLPESEPTITTYCRLLTRIASIMPQLQDDLTSCNTPFTKYEQIIKWDKQMRIFSTERPAFLQNVPIDPGWPCYIPWARRSLAITSAHKIIMIHRSFLSDSFTNSAFSFTRRTCLAAAKTIIKEYKLAVNEDEPTFWVHQAFSVAASIILILDVLHRSPAEFEYAEHKQLAEDTVAILRQCQNSMIATRGIELLSALFDEIPNVGDSSNSRKRRHEDSQSQLDAVEDFRKRGRRFSVSTFIKTFCNGKRQNYLTALSNTPKDYSGYLSASANSEVALMASEMGLITAGSLDLRPGQHPANDASFFPPGLEAATAFDNLLFLANHDFS